MKPTLPHHFTHKSRINHALEWSWCGVVENLKLSTGGRTFLSEHSTTRELCEFSKLQNKRPTEPHLEVVRSPTSKDAYIAILLRNGVAVFEELPQEITESDHDHDLSIFWAQVRKRLQRKLERIEKLSA